MERKGSKKSEFSDRIPGNLDDMALFDKDMKANVVREYTVDMILGLIRED